MKRLLKRFSAALLALVMLLLCVPSFAAFAETEATPWYDDSEAYTGEYAYSLAVVGDTQTLTYGGAKGSAGYNNALPKLYQWIVDNAEAKKMQYVIGLGDITEKGEDYAAFLEALQALCIALAKEMASDGDVPRGRNKGACCFNTCCCNPQRQRCCA